MDWGSALNQVNTRRNYELGMGQNNLSAQSQQRDALNKQVEQINKIKDAALMQSKSIIDQIDAGNKSREEAKPAISTILGPVHQTLQMAEAQGIIPQGSTKLFESQGNSLFTAPTPDQLIAQKAKEKGAIAGAEAPYKTPVEVADPNSPTGISYQTPTGSIGQPAPAPVAPTTNIIMPTEKIVNKGEEAATTTYGAEVGKKASLRDNLASEGATQNVQLNRIKLALERGAITGLGAETLSEVVSAASTLGMDIPQGIAESEVIRRIQGEMALRARNPESGLGLTGNTSNKDLSFLKSVVPGLQQSKQGNLAIIDLNIRLNKMKQDIAQYQASIISQHGGSIPLDIESKILDYTNDYQFFSKEEKSQIDALSKVGEIEKPDNVDQIIWDNMRDEDKLLWK